MSSYHLQPIDPETLASEFCDIPPFPSLNPDLVRQQQADVYWIIFDENDERVGRCSLWWTATPEMPDQQVGLIGHYAAKNDEVGRQLLDLATGELAQYGCTIAIGPMDGSTWQSYRFITEGSAQPLFFSEPRHPPAWPNHFSANGFVPLANYYSTLVPDLTYQPPNFSRVIDRAIQRGISFRSLDMAQFEAELDRVYELAVMSFSRNFLYTSLPKPTFLAQYLPIKPYIQPDLCFIAEKNDHPIGFLFAIPSLVQAQRQYLVDTVIVKTLAIDPTYRMYGLGTILVAKCHQAAHTLGFRRAIHALMHEKNTSRKISHRFGGEIIRRYSLFGKEV